MEILSIVILGVLGACVGSFLGVCIDRLPADRSLAYPGSHCDACQHHLSVLDLVPVFSYLFLRGRCRHCGAKVPLRVLWVELLSGLIFAFAAWVYGLSPQLVVFLIYACVFIVLSVIDLEHQLILNKIIYPTAVAVIIINFFLPFDKYLPFPVSAPFQGTVSGLIGGAIGFLFLLIPVVISPRGMGLGDVKLATVIGLMVGFRLVLVALLLGIVLGGLVAVFLLLLRIKKRKEAIPFGPFLTIGTVATLFWGSGILDWYLNLFMR